MNIFYIGNNYPEKRCVINKVMQENYIPLAAAGTCNSVKAVIEKLQHAFAHRYSRYLGEKALSAYWLMKRNGIVHTFNSCVYGKNKWAATFETILPRTNYTRGGMASPSEADKNTIKQFKLLAKENCLGCLALSEATYHLQMDALTKMKAYLSEEEILAIQKKTKVLHPPQELLVTVEEIEKKFEKTDCLELIFVGHDFFRKGGKELLDCLMKHQQETGNSKKKNNRQLHLTVVSSMEYGDYASHATREEMLFYKSLLEKEDWITFYEKLPNEQVLQLCKKAHIGLLPTMADTYGYSVLEMQACGCAMLTTDIRSLSELNNVHCGWICHLPQNNKKEAAYKTEEERRCLKEILKEQIEIRIGEILDSASQELEKKALASWERIKIYHNPEDYSGQLKELFSDAK